MTPDDMISRAEELEEMAEALQKHAAALKSHAASLKRADRLLDEPVLATQTGHQYHSPYTPCGFARDPEKVRQITLRQAGEQGLLPCTARECRTTLTVP